MYLIALFFCWALFKTERWISFASNFAHCHVFCAVSWHRFFVFPEMRSRKPYLWMTVVSTLLTLTSQKQLCGLKKNNNVNYLLSAFFKTKPAKAWTKTHRINPRSSVRNGCNLGAYLPGIFPPNFLTIILTILCASSYSGLRSEITRSM